MRRDLSLGAAVALILVVLASCESGPGSSPESAADYFGINAQHLVALPRADLSELLDRHLDHIAELDVAFVRGNANWGLAQPERPAQADLHGGVQVWDGWVEALAKHGLRWQPTVIGLATPRWAAEPDALSECGSRSPPADPDEFASFAGSLAERFGRSGSFWEEHPELEPHPVLEYEIWNSPNYGFFWCPEPQPEHYGAIYAAARSEIRRADRDARVLVAGLGPFTDESPPTPRANQAADEFVRRMLTGADLQSADVDAIGIHLYGPDPETLLDQVVWFRGVLEDNGLAKTPIVVAEAGWATAGRGGPPPILEEERAVALSAVTRGIAAIGCGVVQYSPHTWATPEADPTDAEDWYGIANLRIAEPYPTAIAYENDIEVLTDDGFSPEPDPTCRVARPAE